jgi:TonB family protein
MKILKNISKILLLSGVVLYFSINANAQSDTTYTEVYPQGMKPDFSIVDSWPMYPGGVDGITKHIITHVKYPAAALEAKVQGVVIIAYLVQKDGTVGEVRVVKSVHPALDQEAIRVIQLMKPWKPVIQRGEPVKVLMQQQFDFK